RRGRTGPPRRRAGRGGARCMTSAATGTRVAAIPWEDRLPGTSDVVWRSRRNPVVARDAVPRANSIFNSAVVAFRVGFAGGSRVDDQAPVTNLPSGRSAAGIRGQIDPPPTVFDAADGRVREIQGCFEPAYDPRVCLLEDRYWLTWCNGYHGPT